MTRRIMTITMMRKRRVMTMMMSRSGMGRDAPGCRATAVSASICKSHSTANSIEANYTATVYCIQYTKYTLQYHCDSRTGCGRALAGSRDFKSAKIPGFLKLKSRDFSGFFVTMFWTPWNALKPKIAKIAKNLFIFSALPSFYLLMERGQHTKTNMYKIQK